MNINRRDFLKNGLGMALASTGIGAAGLILPEDALAITQMNDFWVKDRFIECKRQDNGEKHLVRFYAANGGFIPDGYQQACWMLRDAKDQNAMVSIDPGLLNLMYAIQEWARVSGKENPMITINSAYRTARRNSRIEGAARNSMHIQGKAIDFTMNGVKLSQLEAMAKHFKVGGVGIYNTFIHIDTGNVRSWKGK